jgi:hypothetical protein
MVEHKQSIYDEVNPPMVHVTFANEEINSTESDQLLHAHADATSAPVSRQHQQQDRDEHESVTTTSPPSDENNGVATDRSSQFDGSADPANNRDHDRMVASGTAGAVLGLLTGGPVGALIAGFGLAYYSTRKDGAAGDAARAVGDVALIASEQARELDERHHIVDKTKKAVANAWEKAVEVDRTRQHHVLEKIKAFIIFCWNTTVDYIRRERLLERGVEGVGRGIEYVSERVTGSCNSGGEDSSTTRPTGGAA